MSVIPVKEKITEELLELVSIETKQGLVRHTEDRASRKDACLTGSRETSFF